jgi:hypothetical protein
MRARQGLPRRDQFRGWMGRLGAHAVYASPGGSPRQGARLASGCWPNSTGWARRPTGSLREVSSCLLHLSSSPRLRLAQARVGPPHRMQSGSRCCPLRSHRPTYRTVPAATTSSAGRLPGGCMCHAPPAAFPGWRLHLRQPDYASRFLHGQAASSSPAGASPLVTHRENRARYRAARLVARASGSPKGR